MHNILDLLSSNHLLLLFTIIGLGYLVGSIRIFGFSLGTAAVLFAGIFLGAVDARLTLPEEIYIIGLVFFVYSLGLQSGPTFFSSFDKRGIRSNVFVVVILLVSLTITWTFAKLVSLNAAYAAGVFSGALTNTPALAASVEALTALTTKLPAEQKNELLNSPVIGYGLTYPFGVFGVLLWFYLFRRVFKIDFEQEESDRMKDSESSRIIARTLRVTNPAVVGKSCSEIMDLVPDGGFVFSRIGRAGKVEIVTPETTLDAGDLVMVVGTGQSVERARVLIGDFSTRELGADAEGLQYRRLFVSNGKIVGKEIHELNLEKSYGATITRLRRGDVDLVPDPHTILELGDRVRVVTRHDNIANITKLFGDSMKSISETDFLSISFGIVLGVFTGMIPIPLPNGSHFKLGFAGGPLVVALVLGRLQRTGPITWILPFNANLVLRQIGLVLFLAGIGIKAGHGFGSTIASGAGKYLLAGALITTLACWITIIIGYKVLKYPMSAVFGIMSAVSTQPACLVYANQQAQNDQPNVYYAMVYPVAMITKIILAQIIVSILW